MLKDQQIHHPRAQVRTVGRGRAGYPGGCGCGGDFPAAPTPLVQSVLGDRGHRRGDISDLTAYRTRHRGTMQIRATDPATVGNIIVDLIRVIDQLQRKPLRPSCFPGLRPVLRRNDRGGGACSSPSEDGGFDEFRDYLGWTEGRPLSSMIDLCDCLRVYCGRVICGFYGTGYDDRNRAGADMPGAAADPVRGVCIRGRCWVLITAWWGRPTSTWNTCVRNETHPTP
jgi:hypothetical protein